MIFNSAALLSNQRRRRTSCQISAAPLVLGRRSLPGSQMKITTLLVLKCPSTGADDSSSSGSPDPIVLAITSDVSHFSFFQRAAAKEFIVFVGQLLKPRILRRQTSFLRRAGSEPPNEPLQADDPASRSRGRRVFDLFDHNGDDKITVDELSLALDRLGLGADRNELASTVTTFIRNVHAGLAFEDFESLHRALGDSLFDAAMAEEQESDIMESEESDMEEVFQVFDEDGDGYISAVEPQVVLSNLGLPEGKSMDRVHEMIYSVDGNRDGRVNFGEFKHMMQGISVRGT